MNSLLNRYLLYKYLPRESEQFFQARALLLSHIAVSFLIGIVLAVTTAPLQVVLMMIGILIFSLLAIAFIGLGFLTAATLISYSGIGLLATLAMFFRSNYNNFEVYALVSFHMFITIVASLLTQQRFYTYFTTASGVFYIFILLFVRGLRVATDSNPLEIDDYVIGIFLLIVAGFLMRTTLDRRKRLLEIAEHESRRNLEQAKTLKENLAEKELLLHEVHHRVKNNLNVAISLLNLQIRKLDDSDAARGTLQDSIRRLHAMSLVHERLYLSGDLKAIDFKPYIIGILQAVMRSMEETKINFEIHVDSDINIELAKAVPCGLIINELITNVFKHAFPNRVAGQAEVNFIRAADQVFLIVQDTGIGMSPPDHSKGQTLGMHLVTLLTEQLMGTLEIDGTNGTKVTITFPLDDESTGSNPN